MSKTGKFALPISLAEALPSLVFVVLWKTGAEPSLTGWLATILALGAIALLIGARAAPNPIFLGINLHFAAITPLIDGLFRRGLDEIGTRITAIAEPLVLVTIAATGLALHIAWHQRFVGSDEGTESHRRFYSLELLVLGTIGAVWAFAHGGTMFLRIGLPILILLVVRQVLLARLARKGL